MLTEPNDMDVTRAGQQEQRAFLLKTTRTRYQEGSLKIKKLRPSPTNGTAVGTSTSSTAERNGGGGARRSSGPFAT